MKTENSYETLPENTEINLLVSGGIPKWLGKYFYSEDKALPIRVESGRNGTCKLAEPDDNTEVSADYFMITSINALPAPGIGIDNTKSSDQCSLNLEDFMPQPDSGNDGGSTGNDGDDTGGGGGNGDNTGGDDPSGGSTGD